MHLIATEIPDLHIIEPQVFKDDRGFFLETYHGRRFESAGLTTVFVQDNMSYSIQNVLRGLHFQVTRPQAKLVQVVSGEIFDVAVDIRRTSPTFGRWVSVHLSEQNNRQVYIPPGCAHGFCVLSESARVFYKCSDFYDPQDEGGILWSDPALAIDWPIPDPIVSEKDAALPVLGEIPSKELYNPLKKP
ncbi:MAG: dTDP-4-dehydrorhamnose 3,5-epimerase [Desulfobacterales bacterium]|jgi:dTDP-4-dehydrorhamnose 3,5-epimerase